MKPQTVPQHLDILDTRVDLHGDLRGFTPRLSARLLAEGLAEIELHLESATAAAPPAVSIHLSTDATAMSHVWRCDRDGSVPLVGPWYAPQLTARASNQAPLLCLHGIDGITRLAFASADATHGCELGCGVREEDCRLNADIRPFQTGRAPGTVFTARIRLDRRPQPWHATVQDVSRWWASLPGHTPLPVPAAGREAMYSTWYSFHQAVDPDPVLAECREARRLGCTAVIIDDGWQTLDGNRGYAYAGDWQPERMGDMAAFVRRVHETGLRALLWYSVPMIGFKTKAFATFQNRLLRRDEGLSCGILDPRYPEVRAFLADLYERHVIDWGLDGVKLDFIDCMHPTPTMPLGTGDGRDIGDLDDAVDVLMKGIAARLRACRPDIMIEFRQGYVGPLMRTYGNLFRAADCPYDAAVNRARVVTLRMLCGTTVVHGDMLMWSPNDPAEVAARQLLAVLFGVPQISVKLAGLPTGQRAMLAFWLDWWTAHRATLLDGAISAEEPEAAYPLVAADGAGERVVAVYADRVVRQQAVPTRLWLVNATARGDLVLDCAQDAGERRLVVRDCRGVVVEDRRLRLAAGLHRLAVPASGLAELSG